MKLYLSLLFIGLAGSGSAQSWELRETDRVLSTQEVAILAAGHTIEFYDGGRSKYSAGGAYSYTYASGQTAYGTYNINADGAVCIEYRNGFGRCDLYVESADRIVLLTQGGLRFPVRSRLEK